MAQAQNPCQSPLRSARAAQEAPAPLENPPQAPNAWFALAAGALAVAGASAAFTRLWNFDIFWHLACGEWMLSNGRVLGFDPFSISPQPQWVNVHWLFQIIIAVLHGLGGFAILTALKSALTAALMLAFALPLRRRVQPAWLVFCGLVMLMAVYWRLRVRPEAFTLVFMMAVIALTDSARRDGRTNRLWWLVPIMLAWVNMHGLYVVGLGIVWAGLLGSGLDRLLGRKLPMLPMKRSLAPILTATIACLVNPWTIDGALHFLLLFTRISGQSFIYTYGVSELQPTWQSLASYPEFLLVVPLTVLAAGLNFRSLPSAHAIWLAAMAALGLMAARNVALIGPVCGYLLAVHGSDVIRRLTLRRRRLARAGNWLTAAMVLAALALSAGYVTEWVPRRLGGTRQFGAGLQEYYYPTQAAQFLRRLQAPGDILCTNFGDAGTFIYYCSSGLAQPKRLTFMDGRLEAHPPERFVENNRVRVYLRTSRGAAKAPIHPAVRFIVVRQDDRNVLTAMARSERFKLVYIDPIAAVFARGDWPGGTGDLPWPNFADFDAPLRPDGLLQDRPRRHWYSANPPVVDYHVGSLLLSLGQQDTSAAPARPLEDVNPVQQRCILLAIRHLSAAAKQEVMSAWAVTGSLAHAHQQQALAEAAAAAPALPVDINFARALHLYGQLDFKVLTDRSMRDFAFHRALALAQTGRLSAAGAAIKDILDRLPPRERIDPPSDYVDLDILIEDKLARTRLKAAEQRLGDLPLPARAEAMAAPEMGLVDDAIAELRAAEDPSPAAVMTLGDLLLRTGRPDQARAAYRKAQVPQDAAWKIELRMALCDWVEGQHFQAAEALERLSSKSANPLVRCYLAIMLEQLGLYRQALDALSNVNLDEATRALVQCISLLKRRIAAAMMD